MKSKLLFVAGFFQLLIFSSVIPVFAITSNNIPLDSPIYGYFEKLSGLGLLRSDIRGLKPWTKAEAARLLLEAEAEFKKQDSGSVFAEELIIRIRELLPQEIALKEDSDNRRRFFDVSPVSSIRFRTVYLDGVPRDYNRESIDPAHQSAFGFIGGDLRPFVGGTVRTSGTEGTPLLENNNGVVHPRGVSSELRWGVEVNLTDHLTGLLEPSFQVSSDSSKAMLNRGYLKLGGGGIEFEAGRDENWFGQGYRGTTTLTNNARNFDLLKLSSAEPLDVSWIRNWFGDVKYSIIVSRFNATDKGTPDYREPWFLGAKLAFKPTDWFEIGANFVRQLGGPGFSNSSGIVDQVFGGGENDHSNTIAGADLRFRLKNLRNTELHLEFSGEDNAGGVWPIVESYVTGFYIPCITDSCRDDFRFEYFFGSVMLYGDWQFPRGYVYENMTPGHFQGGNAQEFFGRYSHWFSTRNSLALEYFYDERSRNHRVGNQAMESKHAGRAFWSFPLYKEIDARLGYGIEMIDNLNLVPGERRTNNLAEFEVRYNY
jgi:hypothetical protein